MSSAKPLDELRRRLGNRPSAGAFAALAEEHRRAGRLDEAVAVCRESLAQYPTYVSARVTLGRALLDMGDVSTALDELEHAVAQAPDNLAAVRALELARTTWPDPGATDGEPGVESHVAPAPAADAPSPAPASALAWLTGDTDETIFAPVMPFDVSAAAGPADAPLEWTFPAVSAEDTPEFASAAEAARVPATEAESGAGLEPANWPAAPNGGPAAWLGDDVIEFPAFSADAWQTPAEEEAVVDAPAASEPVADAILLVAPEPSADSPLLAAAEASGEADASLGDSVWLGDSDPLEAWLPDTGESIAAIENVAEVAVADDIAVADDMAVAAEAAVADEVVAADDFPAVEDPLASWTGLADAPAMSDQPSGWTASLDACVDEVFAHAVALTDASAGAPDVSAGAPDVSTAVERPSEPPVASTSPEGVHPTVSPPSIVAGPVVPGGPLRTLEVLLVAIRERRAALASARPGVD